MIKNSAVFGFLRNNIHYIILMLALGLHFWYVFLNMNSVLYGGPGDHTAGLIWLFETDPSTPWWSHSDSTAAPFGENLWNPGYIFSQLVYVVFWLAATATGSGIAGYNIITIAGFIISYLTVFNVGKRMVVGSNILTALVAYLVSFTPFVLFLNAVGHLSYIIAPAYVVALLYCTYQLMVVGVNRRRNALLIGLLLGGAWLIDPYFVLFGALTWAGIILGIMVTGGRMGLKNIYLSGTYKYVLLSVLIGIVMYVPLLGYAYVNSSAVESSVLSVRADITQDAYQYSSRLKDYVLPSASNPFIPEDIKNIKKESFHGNDPTFTLYGGIAIYVVIAAGLVWYAYKRKQNRSEFKNIRLAYVCIVAAGLLFVFSLPPVIEIFGLELWGPNSLIIAITGIWRVFSRLFIFFYPLIGIAFLVVATWLLRRYGNRFKLLYIGLIVLLIGTALSMLPRNPFDTAHFWSVQTDLPSTYKTIKSDNNIKLLAEYPLREAPHYKGSMFFSAQIFHEKPLFNSSQTFTETSYIRQALSDLSNPQTIPALRYLGVDTVQVWNNSSQNIPAKYTQALDKISEANFGSMFGKDSVEMYKFADQIQPRRHILTPDWDSRVWNEKIYDIEQTLPTRHSMSVVDLCTYVSDNCTHTADKYDVVFDIENPSDHVRTIALKNGSDTRYVDVKPGENRLKYTIDGKVVDFEVMGENVSNSTMILKNYHVSGSDK